MPDYMKRMVKAMPRLPLKGSLDLTYRCNNNCRHCWLRIPPGAPERRDELSFDEICDLVDQARAMGCREWSISGGEPMLRPDFADIFDYLTRKATRYSINTNGTLITPQIAQLMRREGRKMVAVYGATAEVHDHVTQTPGSFERTMCGFAYLKEAGADFEVQLIPMHGRHFPSHVQPLPGRQAGRGHHQHPALRWFSRSGRSGSGRRSGADRGVDNLREKQCLDIPSHGRTWKSGGGERRLSSVSKPLG